MTIVWLAAALLLGIAEVLSVDLFFLTLALASLTGAGAALLGLPVWGQLAVVVIASIIMLIFIRPWAKAHLQRSTPDIDTNARGLVGKVAVVTAPLVGTAGRVRLDGGDWSARA